MDHDCGKIPESYFINIDENGEYWIGIDGEVFSVGPISYCPFCGNELKIDPAEVVRLKEASQLRKEKRAEEDRQAFQEVSEIINKYQKEQ